MISRYFRCEELGIDWDICVFADVPHLNKAIRNAFAGPVNKDPKLCTPEELTKQKNHKLWIHEKYRVEANLPTNVIYREAVQKLIDHDAKNELKLVPHLPKDTLQLGNFAKMRTETAEALLSHQTAAGLRFAMENNPEEFPKEYETTAYFLEKVGKWYSLMYNRRAKMALSKLDPEKYDEMVNFLEWFMGFYSSMKLHENQVYGLKPSQEGVILSTSSFQWIAENLIQEGYDYVLSGKMSQNTLENLWSQYRHKIVTPTALNFIRLTKPICLGQFFTRPKGASYEADQCDYLTSFKDVKKTEKTWKAILEVFEPEEDFDEEPLDEEIHKIVEEIENDPESERDTAFMNKHFGVLAKEASLAYVGGYFIYAVILKKEKPCKKCANSFTTSHESDNQMENKLVGLKEFKEGALKRLSKVGNQMFKIAELIFNERRDALKGKSDITKKLVDEIVKEVSKAISEIPTCHLKQIMQRFITARIHWWLSQESAIEIESHKDIIRNEANSSRCQKQKNVVV